MKQTCANAWIGKKEEGAGKHVPDKKGTRGNRLAFRMKKDRGESWI